LDRRRQRRRAQWRKTASVRLIHSQSLWLRARPWISAHILYSAGIFCRARCALRKSKGYTLEKLAELADSSKGYIWELENKNPPRPSADKVVKIAIALGVTADFLLDNSNASEVEDATDQAFFRKYREMDNATKGKIRRMVELWDDDK
jgi:transcriptional regulator with XRE-family HTH domain